MEYGHNRNKLPFLANPNIIITQCRAFKHHATIADQKVRYKTPVGRPPSPSDNSGTAPKFPLRRVPDYKLLHMQPRYGRHTLCVSPSRPLQVIQIAFAYVPSTLSNLIKQLLPAPARISQKEPEIINRLVTCSYIFKKARCHQLINVVGVW